MLTKVPSRMPLWESKHDKGSCTVAQCTRKRDKVPSRVPYQWRKQDSALSRVLFQWIKHDTEPSGPYQWRKHQTKHFVFSRMLVAVQSEPQ